MNLDLINVVAKVNDVMMSGGCEGYNLFLSLSSF